jgi:hypothetical protein
MSDEVEYITPVLGGVEGWWGRKSLELFYRNFMCKMLTFIYDRNNA